MLIKLQNEQKEFLKLLGNVLMLIRESGKKITQKELDAIVDKVADDYAEKLLGGKNVELQR